MTEDYKPEWQEGNNASYSSIVRKGLETAHDGFLMEKRAKFQKRNNQHLDIDALANGIVAHDRKSLAKAITLVESNAQSHFYESQKLLQKVLPDTGNSIRIGITGVPGAGKSTFIEAFGMYLCNQGYSVAVLAVDPSSTVSGGSILGDKTRMEQLSRHDNAFIRPSPSAGALGGVHRKTRETILLCEAAGYDVILVETVGVGQSEVIVRSMVDFFMLLVLTGAGDELQGMKKGIMELADAIIVNKADGDNLKLAKKTKEEYNRILHFLQPATKGWETKAYTCSALYQKEIDSIWSMITSFKESITKSGLFNLRRKAQTKEWMETMIVDQLQYRFFSHPEIKSLLPKFENEVIAGDMTVSSAVEQLFKIFQK